MGTTTQEPQMGLTFEQVWAALMEMREEQRISHEKTEAAIERTQAQLEKTEAAVEVMSKRVDRVTKNVGGLNRSMGALIETLIAARLWEKFDAYKLKRAYRNVEIYDDNNKKRGEIDILLSNGEYVMLVEVKSELDKEKYIDHHINRMELIKKYPPAECKGKKMLGAVAGGTVDFDVQEYAHSVGFFVLELTGEQVRLAETPEGFVAREW